MTPADLRTWRTERALSLNDLGTLLGVHLVTIWRWEAGQREIPGYLELALRYLEMQPMLQRYPPPDEKVG